MCPAKEKNGCRLRRTTPPRWGDIIHYAVEERADHELHTCHTQDEGIQWAQRQNCDPIHVARVRHADKGNPDHRRKI